MLCVEVEGVLGKERVKRENSPTGRSLWTVKSVRMPVILDMDYLLLGPFTLVIIPPMSSSMYSISP